MYYKGTYLNDKEYNGKWYFLDSNEVYSEVVNGTETVNDTGPDTVKTRALSPEEKQPKIVIKTRALSPKATDIITEIKTPAPLQMEDVK